MIPLKASTLEWQTATFTHIPLVKASHLAKSKNQWVRGIYSAYWQGMILGSHNPVDHIDLLITLLSKGIPITA